MNCGMLSLLLIYAIPCAKARLWTSGMPEPPHIPVFQFPADSNRTTSISDEWSGVIAEGQVEWKNVATAPATFSVLQSLITPKEVNSILAELSDPSIQFDDDADSVDGQPTFEFYLQRSGDIDHVKQINGKPDQSRDVFDARKPIRERIEAITRPIVEGRILPFVNERYQAACNSTDRCYVCHSLVCFVFYC
jgi:hypothetical protein